jgi:hypothetical protein
VSAANPTRPLVLLLLSPALALADGRPTERVNVDSAGDLDRLPDDAALAGLTAYTQAVHFFGVTPFALSNVQDMCMGY